MNEKASKIIYWVLTGFVAFILAGSAMTKLSGGEQAAEMANALGGSGNIVTLGILELTIVLIWIIPRTGVLGTLLAIAYLGGAMAVHFVHGESVLIPMVIQIIVWLSAIYRFPELTKRILNR